MDKTFLYKHIVVRSDSVAKLVNPDFFKNREHRRIYLKQLKKQQKRGLRG